MKKILVLGAGLSSSYLIKYLLDHSAEQRWQVTVADFSEEMARSKCAGNINARPIQLDIHKTLTREEEIRNTDLVISLLPPPLHPMVAKDCLQFGKHMITASYTSDAVREMHKDAQNSGVLFLNEVGLDPGIDHMSAMQMIEEIQQAGAHVKTFKSYCGGLVAPEYDNNPWNYKFTWNPRNVVLAGKATAQYKEKGKPKFIPEARIFDQTESVLVPGHGLFESYANRDSLSYIIPYRLQDADTVLRGTLRQPGFCKAWLQLIKLGLTDDSYQIHGAYKMTWRQLISSLLPGNPNPESLEKEVCEFLMINRDSELFRKLEWLGIFKENPVELNDASPAAILQHLLLKKWKLEHGELDMIVMHHELTYVLNHQENKISSSLVVKGEDEVYTAMAKTVGLPMAIAAKLILNGEINSRGVQIPITREFYEPILAELQNYGIKFFEDKY